MADLHKVVHVMRRFVPEKWGGTESVVFNLSQELQRAGVASSIFCTDLFAAAGRDELAGVGIARFRHVLPWLGLSEAEREQLRLKGGSPLSLTLFIGLMREKQISLIHTHVQHRLGGMARTAARLKGIPYVVSIHGGCYTLPAEQIEKMKAPFEGKPEWGKAFGWLFGSRRVLADADAIICVGRNEYEAVSRRFSADRVFYVPNGVQVSRFAEADGSRFRQACGYTQSERIALCVSRIDYQKNQLGLVRAFAAFAARRPEWTLVLIGAVTAEAYRDQLQQEIQQLGLSERVRLIEGMRPDDPLLPSAYRAADLFVLPTHHEPFGIVVLEAWAAQVPVVAYQVGGLPGFATDAENILFVEKDDESGLVEKMNMLADDSALCERLCRHAKEEVSAHYDWSSVAQKVREIYQKIMS